MQQPSSESENQLILHDQTAAQDLAFCLCPTIFVSISKRFRGKAVKIMSPKAGTALFQSLVLPDVPSCQKEVFPSRCHQVFAHKRSYDWGVSLYYCRVFSL